MNCIDAMVKYFSKEQVEVLRHIFLIQEAKFQALREWIAEDEEFEEDYLDRLFSRNVKREMRESEENFQAAYKREEEAEKPSSEHLFCAMEEINELAKKNNPPIPPKKPGRKPGVKKPGPKAKPGRPAKKGNKS